MVGDMSMCSNIGGSSDAAVEKADGEGGDGGVDEVDTLDAFMAEIDQVIVKQAASTGTRRAQGGIGGRIMDDDELDGLDAYLADQVRVVARRGRRWRSH